MDGDLHGGYVVVMLLPSGSFYRVRVVVVGAAAAVMNRESEDYAEANLGAAFDTYRKASPPGIGAWRVGRQS